MKSKDYSVLVPYCENDMRLLKKVSKSIFLRFNEKLTEADYDDFYSLANMVLWQAYNSFEPDAGCSFEGFFYSCLQKKFKTELTHRHRQKRVVNQLAVSLDSLDSLDEDGDEYSLLECIASDFDTFEAAIQDKKQFRDKAQQYINRLSNRQVNIVNLLIDGYKPKEIQRFLGLSAKEYAEELRDMKSFEKVKILF